MSTKGATIIVEGTFREGYEEHFDEYSKLVKAFLKKNKGTVIRRQLITQTLYGQGTPNLIMVIDFASAEIANALFFEPEYLAIVPMRDKIFKDFKMFLAEPDEI